MSNLTLQEQIDQINAELKDLRKSHTGIIYAKGGSNIRSVGNTVRTTGNQVAALDNRVSIVEMDIDYLRNNLDEFVNVHGVDGLEYKNNMLFLKRGNDLVLPGVKIVGGAGGGGTTPSNMTVTIENLLQASAFNLSESQSASIKFKFTSLDSGEPTGNCTCKIYRNTVLKEVFSIANGEEISKDITKILTVGNNDILVECVDIYNNSKNLSYSFNVVSLAITSTFDASKPITTETFRFSYNHSGETDKKVHFIVGSGTEPITVDLPSDADAQQFEYLPTPINHGTHILEVYMTATVGIENIESNHLIYELICPKNNVDTPIISSYYDVTEAQQGTLLSIPYVVYDPTSPTCEISLQISYYDGGELVTSTPITRVVDQTKQTWDIRNLPVGVITFTISYVKDGQTYKKQHIIKITESNINVRPVISGLEVALLAEGRSNSDSDYNVWESNGIATTFTDFNWGTNGWLNDADNAACLRLNGDARIEVDIKPFDVDFKTTGKTLEFEFAIRDVNNRDAVVIDCYDADGNKVGIQATADKMFFNSNNDSIFCNYTENQRLRVGFTVESIHENRFMCVYLNGILSGIRRYEPSDSFKQTYPQTIRIGSSECGIDLYAIRSYSLCLTDKDMVDNYIADIPNIIDKMNIYGDNDLYEKGKISYKKVKSRIPTVTFIGKMPTYKGDKKKKSVRMIFEHPTNPELNFDEILDQIDVQGTSSAGYVRKNWKTKHANSHRHITGQLPAKVFCIKVDYAEATGTHNTQNANLIEDFYEKYPIPPKVIPEGFDLTGRKLSSSKDIDKVRTTISGFPICIFHLDTSDKELIRNITIPNLESGEYNVVFSSKGNFNYDKGAEDVFAFNENYDVECWEFLKNEDPQSFLTPWPELPFDYWEPRYHKDLGNIEDDLEDIQNLDSETKAIRYAEINKKYLDKGTFDRFKKMYEWVESTDTSKATNNALEHTYVTRSNDNLLYDSAEYRLKKFKDEFENYFNLDYCAIYYVYTFFALMVDQRAKNMFLTYWHDNAYGSNDDDENPGHWYPYFYDNDTCYGISNKGHLDFDYYHQDHDSINGSNVFNGANSVLWRNFRECFKSKIAQTYAELRSDNKISYNKVINQFINEGADKWSATIYNEDADYKYISVSEDKVDGKVQAYPYLFQVRGNGEQHLEYFVDNRIKFCDSKWMCGDYLNNNAMIQVYNPASTNSNLGDSIIVREPKMELTITPFSKMYYGVQYGLPSGSDATEGMISKLAGDTITPLVFENTSLNTSANDFETYIYNASEISSLGDLSYLYPKQVLVSNCVKLTDLTIGCREEGPNGETYYNPNLTTVVTGNNTLLRTVDVSNCPNLIGTLNLGGCINLEEVYAKGTGITAITLPQGGYINTLALPNTFKNLTLKGQKYLTTDGIDLDDFKTLTQLTIDNCPKLNVRELLEKCKDGDNYTVQAMRLTNIDLGDVTYDYLMNKLTTIQGIDSSGIVGGYAYIEGRCKLINGGEPVTGAQLAEIKRKFPYLTIYYDALTLNVTFKDETGQNILLGPTEITINTSGNSSEGVALADPVAEGQLDEPIKTSTAQYDFTFGGWSRTPNSEPNSAALLGISADTVLYVAFNKTVRSYPVTFYVDNKAIKTVQTPYGSTAEYGGDPRDMLTDVNNPKIYTFTGWAPPNTDIHEPTECYAQFTLNDGSQDIPSYALTEFDYTINESQKTITLNKANVIENTGKIEQTYNLGQDYTVTAITNVAVKQTNHTPTIGCFEESQYARTPGIIVSTNVQTPGVTHQIEYVVLPESLKTIGNKAFNSCKNLVAIKIPKNVVSIGQEVFDDCLNLDIIEVDPSNTTFRSQNNCLLTTTRDGTVLITGSSKSCDIPEGVNIIDAHAFWGRDKLTTVALPKTLKKIGTCAFCECDTLRNINIPEGVKSFDSMCFYKTGISDIVFPASTTNIGMYATHYCSSLKNIYIKQKDPKLISIDSKAFGDNTETGTVSNPAIHIYVRWTEESKGEVTGWSTAWGAKNAVIHYGWDGVIK